MKKIIALILILLITLSFSLNVFADSKEIMPRYNNVQGTESNFFVDSSGNAHVIVKYQGYYDTIQSASITVKLEKRFLFAFWNDVAEWSASSENVSDTFQFTESVGKGTYRATIELQIYGSGGATDVITDQLEYKY